MFGCLVCIALLCFALIWFGCLLACSLFFCSRLKASRSRKARYRQQMPEPVRCGTRARQMGSHLSCQPDADDERCGEPVRRARASQIQIRAGPTLSVRFCTGLAGSESVSRHASQSPGLAAVCQTRGDLCLCGVMRQGFADLGPTRQVAAHAPRAARWRAAVARTVVWPTEGFGRLQ